MASQEKKRQQKQQSERKNKNTLLERLNKPVSIASASKEKMYFIENLALLLLSGIAIDEALDALRSDMKSTKMVHAVESIQASIDKGGTLWKAIDDVQIFPEYVSSLIRIGEETGSLTDNLQVIAREQDKSRIFRSKLRSAMLYPIFVLIIAAFVGIGVTWFILPRLALVFSQLNIDLPTFTRALIWLGQFLGTYGYIVIPLSIFLLTFFIYILFVKRSTRHIGQLIIFKIPVVGRLVKEIETARFGYLLGTLLNAGLPIVDAMNSLSQSASFSLYRHYYGYLTDEIESGVTFEKAIHSYKKVDKLMPRSVQQIVIISERSGNLSESLLRIGEVYQEKIDNTSKNMTVLLEPILLVIVWLGVVWVALAIILPIYSLVGNFNQTESLENPVQPSATQAVGTPKSNSENVLPGSVIPSSSGGETVILIGVNSKTLLYSQPDVQSDVIEVIGSGSIVTLLQEDGDWYALRVENKEGWVQKSDVRF